MNAPAKPLLPGDVAAIIDRLMGALEGVDDWDAPVKVSPKDLAVAMGMLSRLMGFREAP